MKKIGIFIFLNILLISFLLSFLSCEKDELCDQKNLTPQLIIRFYDKDKPTKTKKVSKLLVSGFNYNKALYLDITTDSITLPLKVEEKSTSYWLVKNAKVDKVGKLLSGEEMRIIIHYNPKEIFVSKACGYKVNFENLSVDIKPSSAWVTSSKIENKTINNENKAQVYLYH